MPLRREGERWYSELRLRCLARLACLERRERRLQHALGHEPLILQHQMLCLVEKGR